MHGPSAPAPGIRAGSAWSEAMADPADGTAWNALADACAARDPIAGARLLLRAAVCTSSADQTWPGRALAAAEAARNAALRRPPTDETAAILLRALRSLPHSWRELLAYGLLSMDQGRLDDALTAFRCATIADPGEAQAPLAAGMCFKRLLLQRWYGTFARMMRWAIRLDPSSAAGHAYLAQALNLQGGLAGAILAARRSIALAPDNIASWLMLSQLHADTEQFEDALRIVTRLARLDDWAGRLAERIETLRALVAPAPRRAAARFARWPTEMRHFTDFRDLIKRKVLNELPADAPIVSPTTSFFTLGSCFAQNVGLELQRRGHRVHPLSCAEELNNTHTNRRLLEALRDGTRDSVVDYVGRRVGVGDTSDTRAALEQADVVIYTLGVAAGFFDRVTGKPVIPQADGVGVGMHSLATRCDFRTTSVAENLDNMEAIVAALRAVNPRSCIILSVSPVPLKGTFERSSPVLADCVSKSILRVVADELMRRGIERLWYWPSFEIVRWLAPQLGRPFAVQDDSTRHVDSDLIELIVELFIESFSGDRAAAT